MKHFLMQRNVGMQLCMHACVCVCTVILGKEERGGTAAYKQIQTSMQIIYIERNSAIFSKNSAFETSQMLKMKVTSITDQNIKLWNIYVSKCLEIGRSRTVMDQSWICKWVCIIYDESHCFTAGCKIRADTQHSDPVSSDTTAAKIFTFHIHAF